MSSLSIFFLFKYVRMYFYLTILVFFFFTFHSFCHLLLLAIITLNSRTVLIFLYNSSFLCVSKSKFSFLNCKTVFFCSIFNIFLKHLCSTMLCSMRSFQNCSLERASFPRKFPWLGFSTSC